VGPCHHGMVRRGVADGGDCLQTCRVAVNTWNKHLWQSTRGGPPGSGLGEVLTVPHRKNNSLLRNVIRLCAHGNESSGFIKVGEFIAELLLASQKDSAP